LHARLFPKEDQFDKEQLAVLLASFKPPGIQLQQRRIGQQSCCCCQALYSLLDMAEGQERPHVKQLLKPYNPGKDRFAGCH